jgi:NADPH:quinone reductase-like Zn-dependent oxidoreductase
MFDVAGNRSVADCKSMLKPGGTYVPIGGRGGRVLGPLPRLVRAALAFRFGNKRLAWFVAHMDQEDMTFLAELLESGQLKPVIENTYPLAEAPTALRNMGDGHAKGKSVITV